MRHFFAIIAVLIGTLSGFAEDNNSVIWGIKASVDIELPGKWHRDGGSVDMYRHGSGFTAGFVSNIYLGRGFYFEPGVSLAYSQYRFKDLIISDDHGNEAETDPKTYKWAVQVPLVVGYGFDITDQLGLDVFTGPQIRYAFAGDIAFKTRDAQEIVGSAFDLWAAQRRFDLSWKVGIGLPINSFQISLEADFGLTDLLKNSKMTFRENRVALGITYYF